MRGITSGRSLLSPTVNNPEFKKYLACYERIAEDDLLKSIESQPWRRHIPLLRMIGDTEGKLVVDIGAGKGWTLSRLKGTRVAVDLAQAYLRRSGSTSNYRIRAAAEFLPLRNGCVDVVICDSVLEHVLEPIQVVEEMRRILDENGRCFVCVPYKEDLSQYQNLAGIYPYTHLRSFDDISIFGLFGEFRVTKMRMVEPKTRPQLFQILVNQFKKRLPTLYKAMRSSSVVPYAILCEDSLLCLFCEPVFVMLAAWPMVNGLFRESHRGLAPFV
jgi:ubiquinone/menaquinone biosynthesis C-methylase UbiE